MVRSEGIICLGSIGPGPRTDVEQSVKFIAAWNDRYPNYHAFLKRNPHDFGTYTEVAVPEEKFIKGLANQADFPGFGGIEDAATSLADELGLDY